jgi:hypothetical protein
MSRVGWLGAALVFAAVDAAYVLLLNRWIGPRAPEENARSYFMTSAITAGPAALAGVLVWRAWWLRIGARLGALDAPARLLAAAVATLPADRRDWGSAMTAELAQVTDRRERWRFAAGCARTAVFPPRGHRVPVLVVAALAAAVVVRTGPAVGRVLPELRVFAVTFAGLAGALATVTVSRARRLRRPASGPATTITGLAGVAGCIAVTAYAVGIHVSLDRFDAVTLAVLLAAALWLTLAPPRALTTSRRARRAGLGVGVAVAGGMLLNAHLNDISAGQSIGLYILGVPVVALFVTSWVVAATDRSFGAGLQATVWTVVVTCLPGFVVYVIEAFRYQQAGIHPIDGDPSASLGMQLHEAITWMLVYIPAAALPFGVFGAVLGAVTARPPSPVPAAGHRQPVWRRR